MVNGSYQPEGPGSVSLVTPMSFLPGEWRVHRDITDRRDHRNGVFVGRAVFEPGSLPGELSYAEEGEITIAGSSHPAGRRLIYRDLGGPAMDVRFADGRPFYRLELLDGRWSADHPCGADHYRVTGRVLHPGAWTERWHTVGPAKDYDLDTTYTRIG